MWSTIYEHQDTNSVELQRFAVQMSSGPGKTVKGPNWKKETITKIVLESQPQIF